MDRNAASTILHRLPLAGWTLVVGLVFGGMIWLVLDLTQTARLRDLFDAEFTKRLQEEATDDRLRFDRALVGNTRVLELLAMNQGVRAGLLADLATAREGSEAEILEALPGGISRRWLASQQSLPDVILALTRNDQAFRIFRLREGPIPEELRKPSRRLLENSSGQELMMELGGALHVISTVSLQDDAGLPAGRLMAASRLNDRFLIDAEGLYLEPTSIVAILSGNPLKVVASSSPERIPAGTRLEDAMVDHLATGQAFFDYGSSEVPLTFITFIARDRLRELANPVLNSARHHRTLMAAILTSFFLLLLFLFSARIRRLIGRVTGFTEQVFGVVPPDIRKGDELVRLERAVEHLTEEVMSSREALEREAERLRREVRGHLDTELRLREAKTQAELASRSKSEFLASMSHELRTPLNAIIGFADAMRSEVFGPIGNPKYQEYPRDIHVSGLHLLELINEILDVSKIEAGKLELHEEDTVIADAIRTAVRLVAPRAEVAGVRIKERLAARLPLVRADERRLKQVLLNLLSNAVKFTPRGGEVVVAAEVGDRGGVILSVIDNGIGMTGEEIVKALEPFGQVDSRLARRYEGTGLGLPLVQGLMELHGGELLLESEKGRGTTASVRFPPERSVWLIPSR